MGGWVGGNITITEDRTVRIASLGFRALFTHDSEAALIQAKRHSPQASCAVGLASFAGFSHSIKPSYPYAGFRQG